MAEWLDPVFDRTQEDVDYAIRQLAMGINDVEYKGCFNKSDLNRIEQNTKYLADSLKTLYYFCNVTTADWYESSIPNAYHIARIVNNVDALMKNFIIPPEASDVPNTLLTYEQVNDIEKDLYLIMVLIHDVVNCYRECNTFECGEE